MSARESDGVMFIQINEITHISDASIESMSCVKGEGGYQTTFILRSGRSFVTPGNWPKAVQSARKVRAIWCYIDHYDLRS